MEVLLENNKQVIKKLHRLNKGHKAGEQIDGKQLSDLLRNTADILHFVAKTNVSEDETLKGKDHCLDMITKEFVWSESRTPEDIPEQLEMFLQTYRQLIGGKYRAVKTLP